MISAEKIIAAAGLAAVVLFGCTEYPISKAYVKQAAPGVTIPMVQGKPSDYEGKIVIWGGRILEVVNDSAGSRITVIETALDDDGYPGSLTTSMGRFIAMTRGFLDPAIYSKGRLVTIAGGITGVETRALGKGTYRYPVLDIKEMRYWQTQPYIWYPSYYDFGFYPWHRYGWYARPYGYMRFDGPYYGEEYEEAIPQAAPQEQDTVLRRGGADTAKIEK